jgi:hypothetical protein
VRKEYKLNSYRLSNGDYYGEPYILENKQTIKREKISECEIDRPPFEEKETVYIPEVDSYTTIERVARSTDGSVFYNVTYVIRELEESNKEEVEKSLDEELIKYSNWLKKNTKPEVEAVEHETEVYIDPTLENGLLTLTCYYNGRKYIYENINASYISEVFTKSYYMPIDKTKTNVFVDKTGLGSWVYEALLGMGYNVESMKVSGKTFNKE